MWKPRKLRAVYQIIQMVVNYVKRLALFTIQKKPLGRFFIFIEISKNNLFNQFLNFKQTNITQYF